MKARARSTLVLAVLTPILFLSASSSSYVCYPSPKWINTRTAPRYSEMNFRFLALGATNEVIAKLGPPIRAIPTVQAGVETWAFTWWGKIVDWDDTWLRRWLVVSNGVVIEKQADW